MALGVATGELIGTILEAFGYGIYLVVFPQCIAVIKRKYRKMSSFTVAYFLITMSTTLLLITLHLIIDLVRLFQAYTATDAAGAAEKYFAIVDTSFNITKVASYVAVTLLADAVVIFRTYVVWGRTWWHLIIPLCLFGVDFGMSVWLTWSLHQATPGNSVLVSSAFDRTKYFFFATLAVNLFCTVMIAFKIWSIRTAVRGVSLKNAGPSALSIILESAAIYVVALVVLIGSAFSDSSALFIFFNSMPPLIGSVFSYVILRSATQTRWFNVTTQLGSSIPLGSSNRNTHPQPNQLVMSEDINTRDFELRQVNPETGLGVHVHLEHTVHRDGDALAEDDLSQKNKDSWV
ncbi:hypothetical protein GYMLUDRAFT_99564 [Collybiopsis luxurians FD-317 M1]|uniref:Uncharacterized protein n=1 Tax=Collybiopsis luxurians FD-317 M1 TaxID=944289 RepID=A0A0D0AXW8_9AGAR|nr:hypothetical protein GYMLUDRAFT_99564 [Collybiopsis luxurians FD-317 M1]